MTYRLSASRLQTYQRCPQAYYFQYERRMGNPAGARAKLGQALHQTLAMIYRDWSYGQPMPWAWVMEQWHQCPIGLTLQERQDGAAILQRYYAAYLQGDLLRKPVAVEGKSKGIFWLMGLNLS